MAKRKGTEQELRKGIVMELKEFQGDWFLDGKDGPEVRVDGRNGDLIVDGVRYEVQVVRKDGAPKTSVSVYDHRDRPEVEELRKDLKKFGVRVYSNPECAGSDAYGYVFADRDLSRSEIRKVTKYF